QFFTWMDIDQTNGNLFFVYYDRRNHPDTSTDVYIAVSKDGGETFIETMVSDSAFQPNNEVFFGDYNNIAAHAGVVRPVWTRLDDKNLSVYSALVDSDLILNPRNANVSMALSGKLLQIFRSNLPEISAKIRLTDINGDTIQTWNSELRDKNEFTLQSELQLGVYYVEIDDVETSYRRQLVVSEK
ncbi:MAG TPA: hypothetical protein VJ911_06230, partial [Cryomorphaceae bacterium]|nr:hypothetical protein [Cryomorphaceae bacterium]